MATETDLDKLLAGATLRHVDADNDSELHTINADVHNDLKAQSSTRQFSSNTATTTTTTTTPTTTVNNTTTNNNNNSNKSVNLLRLTNSLNSNNKTTSAKERHPVNERPQINNSTNSKFDCDNGHDSDDLLLQVMRQFLARHNVTIDTSTELSTEFSMRSSHSTLDGSPPVRPEIVCLKDTNRVVGAGTPTSGEPIVLVRPGQPTICARLTSQSNPEVQNEPINGSCSQQHNYNEPSNLFVIAHRVEFVNASSSSSSSANSRHNLSSSSTKSSSGNHHHHHRVTTTTAHLTISGDRIVRSHLSSQQVTTATGGDNKDKRTSRDQHREQILAHPPLAIPVQFPGWFEILSEDGRAAPPIESVAELARLAPAACLVRAPFMAFVAPTNGADSGGTNQRSMVSKITNDLNSDQVREIKVHEGDILTIGRPLLVSDWRAPGDTHLRVRSLATRRWLLLPLAPPPPPSPSAAAVDSSSIKSTQKFTSNSIKVSPVAKSDHISGVHTIASLLAGKRLPITVRLVSSSRWPHQLVGVTSGRSLQLRLASTIAQDKTCIFWPLTASSNNDEHDDSKDSGPLIVCPAAQLAGVKCRRLPLVSCCQQDSSETMNCHPMMPSIQSTKSSKSSHKLRPTRTCSSLGSSLGSTSSSTSLADDIDDVTADDHQPCVVNVDDRRLSLNNQRRTSNINDTNQSTSDLKNRDYDDNQNHRRVVREQSGRSVAALSSASSGTGTSSETDRKSLRSDIRSRETIGTTTDTTTIAKDTNSLSSRYSAHDQVQRLLDSLADQMHLFGLVESSDQCANTTPKGTRVHQLSSQQTLANITSMKSPALNGLMPRAHHVQVFQSTQHLRSPSVKPVEVKTTTQPLMGHNNMTAGRTTYYDEIDQIYDYVRGWAPLPAHLIHSEFNGEREIIHAKIPHGYHQRHLIQHHHTAPLNVINNNLSATRTAAHNRQRVPPVTVNGERHVTASQRPFVDTNVNQRAIVQSIAPTLTTTTTDIAPASTPAVKAASKVNGNNNSSNNKQHNRAHCYVPATSKALPVRLFHSCGQHAIAQRESAVNGRSPANDDKWHSISSAMANGTLKKELTSGKKSSNVKQMPTRSESTSSSSSSSSSSHSSSSNGSNSNLGSSNDSSNSSDTSSSSSSARSSKLKHHSNLNSRPKQQNDDDDDDAGVGHDEHIYEELRPRTESTTLKSSVSTPNVNGKSLSIGDSNHRLSTAKVTPLINTSRQVQQHEHPLLFTNLARTCSQALPAMIASPSKRTPPRQLMYGVRALASSPMLIDDSDDQQQTINRANRPIASIDRFAGQRRPVSFAIGSAQRANVRNGSRFLLSSAASTGDVSSLTRLPVLAPLDPPHAFIDADGDSAESDGGNYHKNNNNNLTSADIGRQSRDNDALSTRTDNSSLAGQSALTYGSSNDSSIDLNNGQRDKHEPKSGRKRRGCVASRSFIKCYHASAPVGQTPTVNEQDSSKSKSLKVDRLSKDESQMAKARTSVTQTPMSPIGAMFVARQQQRARALYVHPTVECPLPAVAIKPLRGSASASVSTSTGTSSTSTSSYGAAIRNGHTEAPSTGVSHASRPLPRLPSPVVNSSTSQQQQQQQLSPTDQLASLTTTRYKSLSSLHKARTGTGTPTNVPTAPTTTTPTAKAVLSLLSSNQEPIRGEDRSFGAALRQLDEKMCAIGEQTLASSSDSLLADLELARNLKPSRKTARPKSSARIGGL